MMARRLWYYFFVTKRLFWKPAFLSFYLLLRAGQHINQQFVGDPVMGSTSKVPVRCLHPLLSINTVSRYGDFPAPLLAQIWYITGVHHGGSPHRKPGIIAFLYDARFWNLSLAFRYFDACFKQIRKPSLHWLSISQFAFVFHPYTCMIKRSLVV